MSVLGLATALAGCQGKHNSLTYDRFRQVEPYASTPADVVELLGEPDHRLGESGQDVGESIWVYWHPEDHLFARIEFDGGTVVQKEWIDAPGARWEDSFERTGSAPDCR